MDEGNLLAARTPRLMGIGHPVDENTALIGAMDAVRETTEGEPLFGDVNFSVAK